MSNQYNGRNGNGYQPLPSNQASKPPPIVTDQAIADARSLSTAIAELAAAIQSHAEATRLLARATAGEFDSVEEMGDGERFLDGPSQ